MPCLLDHVTIGIEESQLGDGIDFEPRPFGVNVLLLLFELRDKICIASGGFGCAWPMSSPVDGNVGWSSCIADLQDSLGHCFGLAFVCRFVEFLVDSSQAVFPPVLIQSVGNMCPFLWLIVLCIDQFVHLGGFFDMVWIDCRLCIRAR